jgi:hypothetical protein
MIRTFGFGRIANLGEIHQIMTDHIVADYKGGIFQKLDEISYVCAMKRLVGFAESADIPDLTGHRIYFGVEENDGFHWVAEAGGIGKIAS